MEKVLYKIFLFFGLLIGVFLFWLFVIFSSINNNNTGKDFSDQKVKASKAANQDISVAKQNFSFVFGGDMMFDRSIDYFFRGDKIFDVVKNINDVFQGFDLSLINLEGPISKTEIPADNTANNLVFNFPPKTAEVLQGLGIKAVSLANNHTLNNGVAGFDNTIQALLNNAITPIGKQNGIDENSIARFYNQDRNKTVSVIAVQAIDKTYDLKKEIEKEKRNNSFVIIFPHWGSEYEKKHSVMQEAMAHKWISYGADMIVGSHPHVIQDIEIFKGKPIFYSLGNLLFDQTFSEETKQGMVISGKIENNDLTEISLMPTISENLKPRLMTEREGKDIIKNICQDLDVAKCNRNKIIFDEKN